MVDFMVLSIVVLVFKTMVSKILILGSPKKGGATSFVPMVQVGKVLV
jgi:hypothetical protein